MKQSSTPPVTVIHCCYSAQEEENGNIRYKIMFLGQPFRPVSSRFMCSMKKTLLIIRGMETSVPLETVHAIHCPYARHCAGVHYKHCVLAFIESRPQQGKQTCKASCFGGCPGVLSYYQWRPNSLMEFITLYIMLLPLLGPKDEHELMNYTYN